MNTKVARRYHVLPDRGVCMHSGCAWHRDGDTAELLGHAHAENTGHEVRVSTSAVVIFGSPRQHARAGTP
jgi:hypothetical protein